MTMIAGALLADGVLMAADCRVTWESPTGAELHTDIAQKLIAIGRSTVLGYSGDVVTINLLLPHIHATLRRHRRRDDALSVSRWLPRFLRRTYRALARTHSIDRVSFLAAGSIKGRPTRLSRREVMEAAEQMSALGVKNWLLMRCLGQLTSTRDDTLIVPESSQGLLYEMKAPRFTPVFTRTLDVAAVGSGQEAVEYLRAYKTPMMWCRADLSGDLFCEALFGYFLEHGESTVGGMLMLAHAVDGVAKSIVLQVGKDSEIRAERSGGNFVVRNTVTGHTVTLRAPSEILRTPPTSEVLFDDFRSAIEADKEHLRARRQEVVNRLEALRLKKSGSGP